MHELGEVSPLAMLAKTKLENARTMIEAVTAILVCGEEVFVIKRQPHLRAFPGYHAFPGGKIDAEDDVQLIEHSDLAVYPQAHISALHRELLEELQFDLAAAFEQGMVQSLSLFGKAVTPEFERIRFSAYYYKIVIEHKPAFTFEENEIAHGDWYQARDLHDQYLRGESLMVVPMCNTLKRLAEDMSAEYVQPFNIQIPAGELACLELIHGLRTLPIPSNTLLPASNTNALLLGDEGRRQVLVDPSPKSPEVYQQLLETMDGRGLDAILISHHHPDHHEYAMDLAREKQLPVLLTERTVYWLNRHYAEDYLEGVTLELISEGSVVTHWKNSPVRAYELPGHDEGMVGLAPDTLDWFFIADLAQTMGSILIPDEGGDLAIYMHSLQRVIDLKPKVVLPSHGIPAGGTVLLERTLQHRLKREAQIRKLKLEGASETEIFDSVYPGLDSQFEDFARQTIRQHLYKIEAELRS